MNEWILSLLSGVWKEGKVGEAISSKEACVVNPADDYCKAWMEVLCMAFSSGRGFQEGAVCVWARQHVCWASAGEFLTFGQTPGDWLGDDGEQAWDALSAQTWSCLCRAIQWLRS